MGGWVGGAGTEIITELDVQVQAIAGIFQEVHTGRTPVKCPSPAGLKCMQYVTSLAALAGIMTSLTVGLFSVSRIAMVAARGGWVGGWVGGVLG